MWRKAFQVVGYLGCIMIIILAIDTIREAYVPHSINSIPSITAPQINQLSIEDTVILQFEGDSIQLLKYDGKPLKLNQKLYIYR